MTEERKAFQHLPASENPQFLEDGKRMIWKILNQNL